ncbi:MAG: phage tail protein [Spirochaetota bacterium]
MQQLLLKMRNWLLAGMCFGFGILLSYAFAVTVGTLNTFTSGSSVSSSQINANFATLKTAIEGLNTEVQTNLTSITNIVPVGTILPYTGDVSTPPTGYFHCNGGTISRTDYPALFALLGTTWGSGDGSTTFNLPDCREAAAIGAGTSTYAYTQHNPKTFGTYQNDQLQGFEKYVVNANPEYLISTVTGGTGGFTYSGGPIANTDTFSDRVKTLGFISDGSNGTPRTGSETRGKQFVVNFIIKY